MRFQLVITDEAERDIEDAFRWYQRQAGLGGEFLDALDQRLAFIERRAHAIAVVDQGIRRAVVTRFPYNIYFAINGRHVDVLAVWHGSRNPSLLSDRR